VSYTTTEQIICNGKWTRFAFYMCGFSRSDFGGRGVGARIVLMCLRTETGIRPL